MKKILSLLLMIHLSVVSIAWSPPSDRWTKIPKAEDKVYFQQNCRSSQWSDIIIKNDPSMSPEKCMSLLSQKIPCKPRYIYKEAYQGIAISIRFFHIPMLLYLPCVSQVFFCQDSFLPVRDLTSVSVKASHVWKQLDSNNLSITGNQIKVGMIDTGIDPLHKEFTPIGIGPDSKIKVGKNIVDPSEPMEELAIYPHGTHVGGIIAGKNPDNPLRRGIAPDASLYVFRVFAKNGGLTLSDILAGIEEAIIHDIDVLNISLGFGGKNPIPSIIEGDPFYEAIKNGIRKGIVICSAAGNSGARHKDNPWTLLAPGLFDKVIQPSASDDRMSQIVSIEWNNKTLCTINALLSQHSPPFTESMSNTPVIDCHYGSVEEFENLSVKGKIALISRGPKNKPLSFAEKNRNAKKAGAIGCIIYNDENSVMDVSLLKIQTNNEFIEQEYIPNIAVSGIFAEKMKNYLQLGAQLVFQSQNNAVIADFSSAGPCVSVDQKIFKPDLCFPGKQINSSVQTYIDSNNQVVHPYEDWDGTSMSTAGTSGCIALLKQAHPNWTPEEIKSACMNNADILINPINHEPFPFFNQGAGQLNILQSVNTPAIITPPSFIHNLLKKEDISLDLTIKNQMEKSLNCSFTIEFFHLQNQPSPFTLDTENASISIAPSATINKALTIHHDTHFSQNQYEGVLWVFIQDNGKVVSKLHIPLLFFQNTLVNIPPVIEPISLAPNRMVPGTPCNLSFRLNAGSSVEINQSLTILHHAQQIRIVAVDNRQHVYQEIFYGENLFIGEYSIQWDGKDLNGNMVLPNGLYHLVAEISGSKVNSLTAETLFHRYPLGSFTVTQSSLPNTPVLIISSTSKVLLYETFAIDLILLHAEEVKNVELTITFPKTTLSPISYTIHDEYVDNNSNLPIVFESGRLTLGITARTTLPKKVKLATFLFRAERISNQKEGISIVIKNCTMTDAIQKEILCNAFQPIIVIEKTPILLGDFNQDQSVNEQDYEMLLTHILEDYLSENWIPQFDLNNDLQIDVNDVFIFSKFME
ncbi:MAG: S8 family serine peptidase [Caldisericia bacterium]|nr:S8 family serine peptidase [Caldisericia bacterium]